MENKFKIGDVVEVTNNGAQYSTFWGFFGDYGFEDILIKHPYIMNKTIHNTQIGRVLGFANHRNRMIYILLVGRDFRKDEIYLIAERGLKAVKSEKQLKIEAIETQMRELADQLKELREDA